METCPTHSFADAVRRAGRVALVVRSTGPDLDRDGPRLAAVALPNGEAEVFDLLAAGEGFRQVADALAGVVVVGHDLKLPLAHLRHHLGIELGDVFDTAIGWRIVDGGRHLKDKAYFSFDRVIAEGDRAAFRQKPKENVDWFGPLRPELLEQAAQEAHAVLHLAGLMQADLAAERLEEVAALEMRLLHVIVEMELSGVPVDWARWERVTKLWAAEAAALEKALMAELGVRNLDNNDEVLAALQRLGIQVTHTNGEALAPYMHLPVVQHLVRYRRLSSFVNGAGRGVVQALDRSHDGRVHPNVNQIGATTGRMSVDHPNMMGLPKDKMIRSCITASPGKKLIIGDYNAIELRVAADQTGDEELRRIFKTGDPHRYMGSILARVAEDQVTKEQRDRAKPVNFGLLLGMGANTLVSHARKNYGVEFTPCEAEEFKHKFFETYAGIAAWQKKMEEDKPAVLRNASGRGCCFFDPDEEYNARLAFPIQGTAADGMKQAMVRLYSCLKPLGAKIILAVHDELIIEAPAMHAEAVKELMREHMIAGMKKYVPSVPIVVEPEVRSSWGK